MKQKKKKESNLSIVSTLLKWHLIMRRQRVSISCSVSTFVTIITTEINKVYMCQVDSGEDQKKTKQKK